MERIRESQIIFETEDRVYTLEKSGKIGVWSYEEEEPILIKSVSLGAILQFLTESSRANAVDWDWMKSRIKELI